MNNTAKRLFAIHTHAHIAEQQNPDQIVYREKDVIALLQSYGIEPPVWDEKVKEPFIKKLVRRTPRPLRWMALGAVTYASVFIIFFNQVDENIIGLFLYALIAFELANSIEKKKL